MDLAGGEDDNDAVEIAAQVMAAKGMEQYGNQPQIKQAKKKSGKKLMMEQGIDMDMVPKLLDQLCVDSPKATGTFGEPDHLAGRFGLPSIDLGLKTSYTTRQWRERERKMHADALKNMDSPLQRSIKRHIAQIQRAEKILAVGKNNKEKAFQLQLAKLRAENKLLAKRLVKLQRTQTEITRTNMPGRQKHLEVLQDRTRFMSTARRAAQLKLDRENQLILKRLTNAQTTLTSKAKLEEHYTRHQRIKKNMCKLTVSGAEMDKYFRKKSKAQKMKLARLQGNPRLGTLKESASLPAMPIENESTKNQLLDNISRPISRPQEDVITTLEGVSDTIRASEDRGQICQEWVEIDRIIPGEQPSKVRALILGFKKPTEESKLLFEISTDNLTRYAQVSFDQMRAAMESITAHVGETPPLGLASIAASRLSLFGKDTDDIVLIWNDPV